MKPSLLIPFLAVASMLAEDRPVIDDLPEATRVLLIDADYMQLPTDGLRSRGGREGVRICTLHI